MRQVPIAHLGPRDIIATCRKLSPSFGANDLFAEVPGANRLLLQAPTAHLGPRDTAATCRKLSPNFGANDLFAAQALTLRWLLATSRAASNLLPFRLPARWSGRTRGEYKSHMFSLFSLFSPPLCCAMEPRRANLGRTTFLFSAGGSPPEVSMRTPLSHHTFPQKTLEVRTRKLYSPEARYSPPRRTREG